MKAGDEDDQRRNDEEPDNDVGNGPVLDIAAVLMVLGILTLLKYLRS